MKKYFLSVLVLFFHSILLFAGDRPKINFQAGMVYFAKRGIERDVVAFSAEIQADSSNYNACAGFQTYSDIVDFTLSGTFYPDFLKWNIFNTTVRLGVGGIYHFQNQVDIAYENDLYANADLNLITESNFSILLLVGYGINAAHIHAVEDDTPWIWEGVKDFGLQIKKSFPNGIDVYVGAGTHDFYRYPTFGASAYYVGGSWLFSKGFKPYLEFSSRMSDMFTTAPYIDKVQLRLGVGYSF